MRSLPRMKLTCSVIGISLLAQPRIGHCLSACGRARVGHVPDRFLSNPARAITISVSLREPADDPDGHGRVKRVGSPPQLVPPRLPDSLERRGFLFWFRRKVAEFLQQRDRDSQEPAALLLGMSEPAVELACPVDDHVPSMSSS